jgi:hypothetical protein
MKPRQRPPPSPEPRTETASQTNHSAMKTSRQTLHRIARCSAPFALAATALLLGACSTTPPKSVLAKNATERHGQVKFSSSDGEDIVGEIAIVHNADYFRAEITKGPGVPLLSISAKFGTENFSNSKVAVPETPSRHMLVVHASGPLAHGGFTWRPERNTEKNYSPKKLKAHYRAWSALPEVFMWGEAKSKGETYQVCLPDLIMHYGVSKGDLASFRYVRVDPDEAGLFLYGTKPAVAVLNDLRDVPRNEKDRRRLEKLAFSKEASSKSGLPVLERVECNLDK